MDNKSGLQTKNATPKPAFSLSQPGLLQRTCECGGVPGLTGQCEGCASTRLSGQRGGNLTALSNSPPKAQPTVPMARPIRGGYSFGNMALEPKYRFGIQAKLAIGQPGDKYEQEADRVAEQVMRMPEPKIQRVCPECEDELQRQPMEEEEKKEEEETLQTKPLAESITPLMQRQPQPTEEEKKKEDEETLQTKTASGESSTVSPTLQNQITALQGGGQPLPASERNFFEPRFGTDFSQVRIHSSSQGAEVARAINARAFTVGRDVVFGTGHYQPRSTGGQRLLAHELTHVVQQRGASVHDAFEPSLQRDTDETASGRAQETSETVNSTEIPGDNPAEQDLQLRARGIAGVIAGNLVRIAQSSNHSENQTNAAASEAKQTAQRVLNNQQVSVTGSSIQRGTIQRLPDLPGRQASIDTMGYLEALEQTQNFPLKSAILASPTLRPYDVEQAARSGTLTNFSSHPGSTFLGTVGEALVWRAIKYQSRAGIRGRFSTHVFPQPGTLVSLGIALPPEVEGERSCCFDGGVCSASADLVVRSPLL